MKVFVSDLSGTALNWAVAKCEGHLEGGFFAPVKLKGNTLKNYAGEPDPYHDELPDYSPSTNWAQGGPIIGRENIGTKHHESDGTWSAGSYAFGGFGPTPLIAAMRCYVSSKFGNTIDIPSELI